MAARVDVSDGQAPGWGRGAAAALESIQGLSGTVQLRGEAALTQRAKEPQVTMHEVFLHNSVVCEFS